MNDNKDPQLTPDIKFQLIKKMESHKVLGLADIELLAHEAKYLEFHDTSGVILFDRNIHSLSQVRELIESVEERLGASGTPPLVMADHEGDFVAELRRLIGVPPAAMAIAATGDAELARSVAYETGQAMAKLGVNVVLAPVADCYSNASSPITGLRTFGTDAERVAEFVVQTVAGFRDAGILTCAKHFPGHGATGGDSHEELPEVRKSLDALRDLELVPFKAAIAERVDMIMTAHVMFSFGDDSDAGVPASFDPRLTRKLLRDELEFDGVVITDALEMEGARAHTRSRYGGLAGGFERSLLAGSDLLLYAAPVPERMTMTDEAEPMIAVEVMQTIIETLHKVVDRDRIDRKLEEAAKAHEGIRNLLTILDESEARVDRLRERAAEVRTPPTPKPEGKVIRLNDYASTPPIYQTVAQRSVTLLRDPEEFIPASVNETLVLVPIEYRPGRSLKRQDLPGFLDVLCRTFPEWRPAGRVVGFETSPAGAVQPVFEAPDRRVILDAQRAAGGLDQHTATLPADAAIVPVFSTRAAPPQEFRDILREFVEQAETPFVIVTGAPIIDWVPASVGCLVTLGASSQVAAMAAAVLSGQAKPTGSLDGLIAGV